MSLGARTPVTGVSDSQRWRGSGALLACLLFGAAAVLSFAPFRVWPVALVSLTGLAWCLDGERPPRRAAAAGFAFGLGYFLTGVSWVYVSMHDFGAMAVPVAAFATVFFCSYLATFPAAAAWLTLRLPATRGARLVLLFPASWALAEWARSWVFTGFPWLAVGYAQSPSGPLSGYAPVLGAYGVSLATAVTAGLLAWWSPWRRPADALLGARRWVRVSLHPALGVLAALWGVGLALTQVAWTQPFGEPVTVSLVQGNIEQDMKWRQESARATLDTYLKLTLTSTARLILLPETALPMFDVDVPREYLEILARHARANGGDILLGVPEYADGNPPRFYNSVASYGTSPTQTYRKFHLVPFGDYVPRWFFITWIMSTLQIPMSDFSHGEPVQEPMAVAGQRVAVNICYEDVFGEEVIRQLPEATLLANFTNDAWWGDSIASEQHLQMSQMRAQETGRTMLRATNTGVTAIIDERGRIRQRAPEFVSTAIHGTVQGYSGSTPFVYWGNWAFLVVTGAMVAGAFAKFPGRRGRK
jgi:apolipoprotein N-acyltransferase